MPKVPSCANRRHHRQRVVAKAVRVFRTYTARVPEKVRPHDAEKLADNLAYCSKPCCRNPRRVRGVSARPIQELRAISRASNAEE